MNTMEIRPILHQHFTSIANQGYPSKGIMHSNSNSNVFVKFQAVLSILYIMSLGSLKIEIYFHTQYFSLLFTTVEVFLKCCLLSY